MSNTLETLRNFIFDLHLLANIFSKYKIVTHVEPSLKLDINKIMVDS